MTSHVSETGDPIIVEQIKSESGTDADGDKDITLGVSLGNSGREKRDTW